MSAAGGTRQFTEIYEEASKAEWEEDEPTGAQLCPKFVAEGN